MTQYYFSRSKFSAGVIIGVSLCTTYVAPHDGNLMSTALKLNRCEMHQAMEASRHQYVPAERARQQKNVPTINLLEAEPYLDSDKDRATKRQRTGVQGSQGSYVGTEENIMGKALQRIDRNNRQYESMFASIKANHQDLADAFREAERIQLEKKPTFYFKDNERSSETNFPGDGPMRLAAAYAAGKIGDVAHVVLGRNMFSKDSTGDLPQSHLLQQAVPQDGVALFDAFDPNAIQKWNEDPVLQWLMKEFNLDQSFLRSAFIFLNEKKTIENGHTGVMGLKVEFYDIHNKLQGVKIRGYDQSTKTCRNKVLRIVSTAPEIELRTQHVWMHGFSEELTLNDGKQGNPFSDLYKIFDKLPIEIF